MKYTFLNKGVTAPLGFFAGGAHCGIRKNKARRDLALIYSPVQCKAAAVYTQNKVKGAPITQTRKNLQNGMAQAIIVNSGIANTCNADGTEKARVMCGLAAEALGLNPADMIVASTGVIGEVLPIEPIADAMDGLAAALSVDGGTAAAEAIMTTDTHPKELAVEFELNGKLCKIGGMAKGSGMIHPNMATMLVFLTTDVLIEIDALRCALKQTVDATFNMISIDGDTSTNDMVSIMASGLAGNAKIAMGTQEYAVFAGALDELCAALSKQIAKDGEGVTKLLECAVTGAVDLQSARAISKSVICSSLVKTAMFGADANWGRVLCAIGYADAEVDVAKVDVAFCSSAGCITVCQNGVGVDFREEQAKKILSENEIVIKIGLHDGDTQATAYGCDLTYDYVKINGDYRT